MLASQDPDVCRSAWSCAGILIGMGHVVIPIPISYGDIDLSWMVGRSISGIELHEPSPWAFDFGGGAWITVECLWRLVERGRIVCCSEDHGHQFGLPVPVDAAEACRAVLAGRRIVNVELREATADLVIEFTGDGRLEFIPNSSGYESWQLRDPTGRHYVATAGGRIDTWMDPPSAP